MTYIYKAQKRFYEMMDAWKAGDIEAVGNVFRADGIGLRDEYVISGPELETMCDIVRTVPGVLGERMLGGGDKGASGALVKADSVEAVRQAVEAAIAELGFTPSPAARSLALGRTRRDPGHNVREVLAHRLALQPLARRIEEVERAGRTFWRLRAAGFEDLADRRTDSQRRLDEACRGHPALRAEVESLLRADDQPVGQLSKAAAHDGAGDAPAVLQPGVGGIDNRVGRFARDIGALDLD